ncbi:very short patch repair endonuclease [Tessaracoccus sp. MC1756]|uniref:very short patch repair endonuclease n=1 Tax=Tessaracoccus sp. MC1756 TaxID=2760311 RepID=UPI0016007591|nr:very short patch repair endonuclease [Tessaracoccus sp. MC1756]MBB1510657.1 very short patch repair endonuclease [Tessaracoccus sp. MC1756]
MARQHRRDTKPELFLRRELHQLGLRYRVDHPLPGMPRRRADVLFTRAKVAVFVDGCFWHACPEHKTSPANNALWWTAKLARNVERDRETDAHLVALGWTVLRVWEHEDMPQAAVRIREAVRATGPRSVAGSSWPTCQVGATDSRTGALGPCSGVALRVAQVWATEPAAETLPPSSAKPLASRPAHPLE